MSKNDGQSFDFTISNDNDAALAKQYMEAQTEVLVKYHSPGFGSAFETESGHMMTEISPAKKEATK